MRSLLRRVWPEWVTPIRAVAHVIVLNLLFACVPDAPALDYTVIPGERFGPVSESTSEAELIERFGADAVSRRGVEIGEGFCVPGTALFAGSDDVFEVTWTDTTRSQPATASTDRPDSRWATPRGVHVGSTLAQLEAIRGEPIEFTGFGWDYGGHAGWSENGTDGGLVLELAPDSASNEQARNDPRYGEILGESTIRSDHPLIREMTIYVERMTVRWGQPAPHGACT